MLWRVRSVLALALVGACGFSVPARDDARVDAPDPPPDMPRVTWAVDATSGKAVPANASEWRDFLKAKGLNNIMAPSGLWLAQESGGSLVDSIGTVALSPFGTPQMPEYGVTVPGWSRKAVGTIDGTFTGFSNMTDASLPNVSSSSMTALVLIALPATPIAQRTFLVEGSSSPLSYARVDLTSSRRLTVAVNTTTATGTQDPGTAPGALMLKLDVTNGQQKVITRKETVTLANTPLGNARGLFIGGANSPAPQARFLYLTVWYGSKAEISDADAAALLTALDW